MLTYYIDDIKIILDQMRQSGQITYGIRPKEKEDNMKKRFLVLVLAAAMALSACGGEQPQKPAEGNQEGNPKEEQQPPAETEDQGQADTDEKEPASGEPVYGGVLKVGSYLSPSVLGYTPECGSNTNIQYLRLNFNSLCNYDETGALCEDLATEWSSDYESKTLTFKLREGVTFSDGTPFNAEAVKWNIEQYVEAKRSETAEVESIETPDESTVVIHLSSWNSSALNSIGYMVYYMSPTAVQENGVEWARENPVGTGPFVLKEWEKGVCISYEKNENYFEEGRPYLDGIDMQIIEDSTTLLNAFKNREIDILAHCDYTRVNMELDSMGFTKLSNLTGIGCEGTGLICSSAAENSPWADAKVRQAMCYAVDVDTLVEGIGFGYQQKINQWAVEGASTWSPNVKGYAYDPEKAKALLAEAGYGDGFDTVLYTERSDGYAVSISEYLDAVGIRAAVEQIDDNKLSDMMVNGWDGLMFHYFTITPDLSLYMSRHLLADGAYYAPAILHPQDCLDILEQIKTAKDEETKQQLSWSLQEKVYDEYALFGLPLYTEPLATFVYENVHDCQWGFYHASAWEPADTWMDAK